jgi:Putative Flp pilus-assembly TadE/G-like
MHQRFSLRTPHGEGGATLVIVVLVLLALFGMIVLVVDVGGLLWARRAMVNASDAAALAAAQSCIGPDEDAVAKADEFAQFNVDADTVLTRVIFESENCHANKAGLVRVSYERDYPLFFGGVLGFSEDGRVGTEATAHWGPAGTTSPIPLVIYAGSLQSLCDVPNVEPGTTCYIWEDNDIGVGGGDFGFLDVDAGWDVGKFSTCNESDKKYLDEWIDGTIPVGDLGLNYSNATWVCSHVGDLGGNFVWNAIEDLEGETRDFPIVGPTPDDGEPAFASRPDADPKYNVIGFAQFEIVDVRMASKVTSGPYPFTIDSGITNGMLLTDAIGVPDDAVFVEGSAKVTQQGPKTWSVSPDGILTWTGTGPVTQVVFDYTTETITSDCGGTAPPAGNNSAHCLVLVWNGATIGGSRPGGGANFGLDAVGLCDRRYGSCLDPPS